MWEEPSRDNYIECVGGVQMWVRSNDESEGILLEFNGGFQVALSEEARQQLLSLITKPCDKRDNYEFIRRETDCDWGHG